MKYSEEQILHILERDREEGAALLMEQYAGLLWSVCQKHLEDTEDIKECVNSSFADFCLAPEHFRAEKGSLKQYLCRIAENKAIDRYHQNIRRIQAEKQLWRDRKETDYEWGLDSVREETESLEEALNQLEPVDSPILRMKYYGGLSYGEIAAELDLSEAAVKMRSLRSRKKLVKILLTLLLLGLLAACAVAALRKYQFSSTTGFHWSQEDPVWELVEGEYQMREGDYYLELYEASYQKGKLKLYFRTEKAEWPEAAKTGYVDWMRSFVDSLTIKNADEGRLQQGNLATYYADGQQYSRAWFESVRTWVWEPEHLADTFSVDVYQGQEILFTLTLSKLAYREVEDEEKVSQETKPFAAEESFENVPETDLETVQTEYPLPDGTRLILGPAMASDRTAIITLYQPEVGEYMLASRLSYSPYGLHGREAEQVILRDKEGQEYQMMRMPYEDVEQKDGSVSRYHSIHFMGAGSGDYTLEIPFVCLERSWESSEVTLTLPTGTEDHISCDETVLFPDGSGLHITGITRTEEADEFIDVLADGTVTSKYVPYWAYTLEYEPIVTGELVLCAARFDHVGTEIIYGSSSQGQPIIRVKGENKDSVDQVTLQFTTAVYLLERSWMTKVHIE